MVSARKIASLGPIVVDMKGQPQVLEVLDASTVNGGLNDIVLVQRVSESAQTIIVRTAYMSVDMYIDPDLVQNRLNTLESPQKGSRILKGWKFGSQEGQFAVIRHPRFDEYRALVGQGRERRSLQILTVGRHERLQRQVELLKASSQEIEAIQKNLAVPPLEY